MREVPPIVEVEFENVFERQTMPDLLSVYGDCRKLVRRNSSAKRKVMADVTNVLSASAHKMIVVNDL